MLGSLARSTVVLSPAWQRVSSSFVRATSTMASSATASSISSGGSSSGSASGKRKPDVDKAAYKLIQEGAATIVFDADNQVFYNKVQVTNAAPAKLFHAVPRTIYVTMVHSLRHSGHNHPSGSQP